MLRSYGYTPEQMDSIGRKLVSIKREIDGRLTEAQRTVDLLIGSGFAAVVASGAYSEQFQSLSDGLHNVSENLEPLGDFLIQYAQAVVDIDQQLGSALRG